MIPLTWSAGMGLHWMVMSVEERGKPEGESGAAVGTVWRGEVCVWEGAVGVGEAKFLNGYR